MTGMEGVQVISLSLGYVMGQSLRAAALIGIADHLAGGPKTVDDLATATNTKAAPLRRLLRTLASGGIVAEFGDGSWGSTPLGDALRSDAAGSVRDAVIWVGEPMHYATCGDMVSTLRTGDPAFEQMFGTSYFDWLANDPEAARVWDAGMACFSSMEDAPIAAAYTFPTGARVVDVGGGQGGFLACVLRQDATLRGILFDRPEVVADPRSIAAAGLTDRTETVAGDFFDELPAGADVYVFKRVLHDWDDATCITLLQNCRRAIAPGGRLLVVDAVIPPGNDPHPAKIVDMVMMGVLRGRERTEAEFRDLLDAAGFRLTKVIPTHSMLAIVESTPC